MIIKKALSYKVKYYAHKLEALKTTSPYTYMLLMTNPCVKTFPPIF